MTDANRPTETVSPERLAEILAGLPHFDPYPDELLSIVCELQRLRSPGGARDKGMPYTSHREALQDILDAYTARSELFTNDADCAANLADRARHGLRLSGEPSERQPDGYAYRYPDGCIRFSGGREINGSDPVESIPYYFRRAPEPRDEPLPPCSTCGGETVPFCTSCGYTTTKPAEYPAYTECQHDHMKPNPTLRATYPKHGSQSGWVQEYRCNVCQCSFERPIATAGLRANGETP